jgi:outer membrane protein OmpA-like peptidoglycan-associated protein
MPMPLAPPKKVEAPLPQTAMLKPAPLPETLSGAQQAAAPASDFEAYRVMFDGGKTDVKPGEEAVLNKIVKKLQSEPNTKLQLRAYADGTPDTTAQARRISLTRALNVRSYLVQQGISATRLDVRALGMGSASMDDQVGKGNIAPDRVDLIFVR